MRAQKKFSCQLVTAILVIVKLIYYKLTKIKKK